MFGLPDFLGVQDANKADEKAKSQDRGGWHGELATHHLSLADGAEVTRVGGRGGNELVLILEVGRGLEKVFGVARRASSLLAHRRLRTSKAACPTGGGNSRG